VAAAAQLAFSSPIDVMGLAVMALLYAFSGCGGPLFVRSCEQSFVGRSRLSLIRLSCSLTSLSGLSKVHFGSTDALAGFAVITANLVVSFYFHIRDFENVARIIKQ
jgi:hypothetical protein